MEVTDTNPRPAEQRQRRWRRTVRTAVIVGCVVVAAVAAARLRLRSFAGRMDEENCLNNLHQIGIAILAYQQDHGGRYPQTLGELVTAEEMTSPNFLCPASADWSAAASPATSSGARATDLVAGGHLSYAYVGGGLSDPVPDDAVVCYEPLANHGGAGMNVLFGDGHAGWVPRDRAVPLLARVAAGEQQVRLGP